jgi:SAM-dependent methyltransferase
MTEVPDFSTITEAPGLPATAAQLERLCHRYRLALPFARGTTVLEVACGAGLGLGLLAEEATAVAGGDIEPKNVEIARRTYAGNPKVQIMVMDALSLPFPDGAFGVVLLYEAIYYLPDATRFVAEAIRVLEPGGMLIICTTNPERGDFHPSPHVSRYYSAADLMRLLTEGGFAQVLVSGAFLAAPSGFIGRAKTTIKKIAVTCNLIPGSLAARAYLKRIFLGPLAALPASISAAGCTAPWVEPVPQDTGAGPCPDYTVLYASGVKPAGAR